MTTLNRSTGTSDIELENGLKHGQRSDASERELQQGHDIKDDTNNVPEQSPRSLHGWKVCPLNHPSSRLHVLTDSIVGHSIHLHVVHNFPLRSRQYDCKY